MIHSLENLFDRDLKRLKKQIESFSDESMIWTCSGTITNSSGHLALHLCGNLQHFIGHVLGGSKYVRNRENEFSSPPIPKAELLDLLSVATRETLTSITQLDSEALSRPYPINVLGSEMTTHFFLIHLYGHLNYHLGQIDYLRRALVE